MTDDKEYDALLLKNQLCFPLYACSKEIVRRYKPYLDEIDLTYTQYIAMMVMWEKKRINVKSLGECLCLDSGTLTPVLKKLEAKGYVARCRSDVDERNLLISVTEKGEALKERAAGIPQKLCKCVDLELEEAVLLHTLLHKLMGTFIKDEQD